MHWIWVILIGAAAGWLAGHLTKGKGFGVLGNIGIGIAGGLLGGWLWGILTTLLDTMAGELITATLGAVILIFVVDRIKS